MTRSMMVKLAALALILALACVPAGAAVSGNLEIFSWWAGDEGPALEALIAKYEATYPAARVINSTVTGGAGVNAKAVLKTRMLGGDPPDTFQVHAGQELIGTWVVAGRMEDLTFLYEEEGWMNVFPAGLLKLLSTDEGIWSVPVNIHRSNVLWYVPENLNKWGVKVPATWQEFLEIAPTLQAKGVVPLSLGENWTATHLWECVAVAAMGPEKWDQLWAGKLSWKSPEVIEAWKLFGEVINTNADAPSLSWQQATDMVVQGQAAFNVMGDWAAGYMATTLKLEPGGLRLGSVAWHERRVRHAQRLLRTAGGCPNRENAIAWLKMLGSREAQDIFNPLKGSISARIDSDMSLYNKHCRAPPLTGAPTSSPGRSPMALSPTSGS